MPARATSAAVIKILAHATRGLELRELFFESEAPHIADVALRLAVAFAGRNKLLLCGNGGSAADCQHIAAEFVNRFVIDRPPLPAIALTTDTSALTAIANDFSFDDIFAKQVQAFGQKGDMFIGISTSGNSANVLKAATVARATEMTVIGLAGQDGGALGPLCDYCFIVPEAQAALVQEVHITLGHLLCSLTDYYLFENVAELTPYLAGEKSLPL